jgi:regulator of sigma E protease
MQWVEYVKVHPAMPIALVVERGGVELNLTVTPKAETQEGQAAVGKIGASVYVPEDLLASMRVNYTLPWTQALPAACQRTWNYSLATLKVMGQMLMGKASVENLSGPISIAQYAGQSASMGLVQFLKFLAIVSVSLGVMNLLPVPMLDGGHLLFYAIEAIKGSPVSEQAQLWFQQMGTALLMSLMALAMFLDVQRLFH